MRVNSAGIGGTKLGAIRTTCQWEHQILNLNSESCGMAGFFIGNNLWGDGKTDDEDYLFQTSRVLFRLISRSRESGNSVGTRRKDLTSLRLFGTDNESGH